MPNIENIIDVTVVDSIGSIKRGAGLSNNVLVDKLTDALVRKMGLPLTGPHGRINYMLHHKESGRQLDNNETLAEAGVQSGDTLRIRSEETAGGTIQVEEAIEKPDLSIIERVVAITSSAKKSDSSDIAAMKEIRKSLSEKRKGETYSQFKGFQCFKIGGICSFDIKKVDERFIFVAMPFNEENNNVYLKAIKPILSQLEYKCKREDEQDDEDKQKGSISIICRTCKFIRKSVLSIVDITGWDPNVLFELGMMYGMGKPVVLLKHKGDKISLNDLPSNLVTLYTMDIISYEDIDELRNDLRNKLGKGDYTTYSPVRKKACAYCHLDFTSDEKFVSCVNDGILHHKECWEKSGGCVRCKYTRYLFIAEPIENTEMREKEN